MNKKKKITKRQAKKYSLIKWKHAVDTGCCGYELSLFCMSHFHLRELMNYCGFCEYNIVCQDNDCDKCPISDVCGEYYREWSYSKTKKTRIKYAKLIYNAIKKV